MKIEAFVSWELRDKNGQLKSFSKKPANSLVIGFADMLFCLLNITYGVNPGATAVTDTGGLSRNFPNTSNILNKSGIPALAPIGIDTYGPVVGTDNTAVSLTQTALLGKIAHGTGGGALSHGPTTATAPATSGTTRSFTIQRVFTNNSPGNITVNEAGLYISSMDTGTVQRYVMLDRTLSTQTINVGTSGTLTYTISVTV